MPLKIRDLIDRIGYPELGIRNLIIFHLIWQTFLNLQKTKMTKSPEGMFLSGYLRLRYLERNIPFNLFQQQYIDIVSTFLITRI